MLFQYGIIPFFGHLSDARENQEDLDRFHEEQGEAYEAAQNAHKGLPKSEQVFQSRDKRVTKHFQALPQIAKEILTVLSKLVIVSNNVVLIYKNKIGKTKITQYSNSDLIKIREQIDSFLDGANDMEKSLRETARAVLDTNHLKNLQHPKTEDDDDDDDEDEADKTVFRHGFDEVAKKYSKLIDGFKQQISQDKATRDESGAGRRMKKKNSKN